MVCNFLESFLELCLILLIHFRLQSLTTGPNCLHQTSSSDVADIRPFYQVDP